MNGRPFDKLRANGNIRQDGQLKGSVSWRQGIYTLRSLSCIIGFSTLGKGWYADSSGLDLQWVMREWLRGRASPCQGEGRGFKSLLPLQCNQKEARFDAGFSFFRKASEKLSQNQLSPLSPLVAGRRLWIPAFAGMTGGVRELAMASGPRMGMKTGERPHPNPLPEGEGTVLPRAIFMAMTV